MESNSGPREEIALSEIITCSHGDENGQQANQEPSDEPAGEMTASFMDKFSLKFNKFITNPFCILIFASLLLTELICCAIQTANLFTKATSTLPEVKINPRYLKYSLTGLLLPPLLLGTALFWIKFMRKKVIHLTIYIIRVTLKIPTHTAQMTHFGVYPSVCPYSSWFGQGFYVELFY